MAWGLSLLLALTQHCDNIQGSHQNTGNSPECVVWDSSTTWVSLQSSVLAECRSGNPAQSFGTALFIVQIPLSCLHYSSDSTKLSHQPAKVLLILLRMLSICSPAEQQGIFQLQAALETFAVHRPSHHYTYHLAERLLMELELILKVASLCGKTLFRPRKGRKLSSSLFFRSISKTFFRLVAVWEGHPGKSVFGNRHFLSLERK